MPAYPFVSVVVPVYNDPEGVAATLLSLVNQTYPKERYEIIIIDNNSSPSSRSVVRKYRGIFDNVKLAIEDKIQGPAAARNTGIKTGEGEIFAFLDADMIADEKWLENGVDFLDRRDADCMGSDIEMVSYRDGMKLWERYEYYLGLPTRLFVNYMDFIPTGALFAKESVFDDVGVFDTRLVACEDVEFGKRLKKEGYELHYCSSAQVYHPTRDSFSELVRQYIKIGKGNCLFRTHHPEYLGSPKEYLTSIGTYLPMRLSEVVFRCQRWSQIDWRSKIFVYIMLNVLDVFYRLGFFKKFVLIIIKNRKQRK